MLSLSDERCFVEVIQAQAKLDNSTRYTQRKKAHAYARRISTDNSAVGQTSEMFLKIIEGIVK